MSATEYAIVIIVWHTFLLSIFGLLVVALGAKWMLDKLCSEKRAMVQLQIGSFRVRSQDARPNRVSGFDFGYCYKTKRNMIFEARLLFFPCSIHMQAPLDIEKWPDASLTFIGAPAINGNDQGKNVALEARRAHVCSTGETALAQD